MRELLAALGDGPHTVHTRRLCPELAMQAEDLIADIGVDIELVSDQLVTVSTGLPLPVKALSTSPQWIDLRLSTQHLLVSAARLLPLLSSALADLYLEKLSVVADGKLRRGSVLDRAPWELRLQHSGSVREAVVRLAREWKLLQNQATAGTSVLAAWNPLIRTLVCLGEVHSCCVEILNGMTKAEFGR